MAGTGQLRYPGAVWVPGPMYKVGYPDYLGGLRQRKRGVVTHSAEGWAPGMKDIILNSPRRASWTFSILLDGLIWQHYEVDINCWHGGDIDDDAGVRANIDLEGWEFEGLSSAPINGPQVAAAANLYRWHQDEHGWQAYETWKTVYEHRWVSDLATSCPSDRIRHKDIAARTILPPAHEEEEDMAKDSSRVVMLKEQGDSTIWLTDWVWKRRVFTARERDSYNYIGILGPVTVESAVLGAITETETRV